ncbi:Fungalysin metallopeptidase-domain-containing protein [Amylostereum chailletii]|nr:Fungalysin metallopeptidase-domain-containing protein [Amylostereum chailletii]
MANFTKLLSTILLAVACASTATAASLPAVKRSTTHGVHLVGRNSELKLETYHPASSFETFGAAGLDHPLAKRDGFDLVEATTEFVKSKLGIDSDSLRFHTGYSGAVSKNAFVKQQKYRVIPVWKQDYDDGFETLTDPENLKTSPNGWLNGTETSGNNVLVYAGPNGNTTTTSESSPGKFIYTEDDTQDPTTAENRAAATTNGFYVVNAVHDIAYLYGFTEAAFNFQDDNFGKGGEGGDRVTFNAQASGNVENADFSTPPDGQSGHMNVYFWTNPLPARNGALSNDIVVHEMTHGITNRMTGGGTARCLQTQEAKGMGEGWSDAFAEWTEQTAAHLDYVVAPWAENKPGGIRTYPYSTNKTTNPLTYASVANLTEPHFIGQYWANLWHNVHAALIDEHGFADDYLSNPDADGGNVMFGHIFIDALPIQPCNPTFQTGRDAIIQADANRYNGTNKCLLWKVYASRGLGVNAQNYTNDATVPDGC